MNNMLADAVGNVAAMVQPQHQQQQHLNILLPSYSLLLLLQKDWNMNLQDFYLYFILFHPFVKFDYPANSGQLKNEIGFSLKWPFRIKLYPK